jgi:hypothetical protein
MGRKLKPVPLEVAARGRATMGATLLDRRRVRNREYMQEWRANPQHREVERKRRDQDYIMKKQRSARRLRLHPYTGVRGQKLCGFCGLGRPVEIVERLRISETDDEVYVKVLVPYCGHC